MKDSRSVCFLRNLVQDALVFVFLLGVLSVFRAVFVALFADTLTPDTPWKDLALTMWYGLRISLKTVGACVLPAFVLGTVLQAAWPKWNGEKFRFWYTCAVLLVLSLLFQMRIPYYQEFHSAFSPFMFNTFHDDVGAIVHTSIEQYHAVERVLLALLIAGILGVGLRLLLRLTNRFARPLQTARRPAIVVIASCLFLLPFAVFIRYGGAFSFHHCIYWKNAARLNQHLLNEAVLDDVQAVYRARKNYKQLRKSATNVRVEEVRAAAASLLGRTEYTEDDLRPLLARRAAGASGPKPQHIFIIVGETYMMWPLLDGYEKYPMASGVRRLLKRSDAVLLEHFLPASNGTMFGLTSVLLGIPELNLFASSRPTAMQPYETALSVQLAKWGYKARFLYGGFSSWNDVGLFMEHQGFEESFYAADFNGQANVWGVPDRDFLQGIPDKIGEEPSFNLVLTSSNHPPYRVDMSREPDLPTVQDFEKMLPEHVADKKLVATRMWHFAYADKYLAEFVETILAKYPNSLFVIVGDHADRWTLEPSPSDYERVAVPLVLVGPAVKSKPFPAQAAGSHMDVAATVLELILPKGTPYYALGKNMFTAPEGKKEVGVSAYYWITPDAIGRVAQAAVEPLPGSTVRLTEEELQDVRARVRAIQQVAAWRVLKGISLNE